MVAFAEGGALLERERELEALRDGVDRACAGEGTLLLIEGPAGAGKTVLAREHAAAVCLLRIAAGGRSAGRRRTVVAGWVVRAGRGRRGAGTPARAGDALGDCHRLFSSARRSIPRGVIPRSRLV